MRKGSRKGRISNDLVAASCAAVLTVYAAGYWRTRDAARQFESQAKARRPVARTQPAAVAAISPVIEPPASAPQPRPEAAALSAPAVARAPRAKHAPKPSLAAPQAAPAPAAAEVGIVVAPIPMPSEVAPVLRSASQPPATPAARWRDGTYTGHGDSPHGDLDVRVVIRDGRIVEAAIQNCNTRYPCELINPLVQQAVVIQSSNVDYVSHATESSQAYNDGLVEALNKALDAPAGKDTASQ